MLQVCEIVELRLKSNFLKKKTENTILKRKLKENTFPHTHSTYVHAYIHARKDRWWGLVLMLALQQVCEYVYGNRCTVCGCYIWSAD